PRRILSLWRRFRSTPPSRRRALQEWKARHASDNIRAIRRCADTAPRPPDRRNILRAAALGGGAIRSGGRARNRLPPPPACGEQERGSCVFREPDSAELPARRGREEIAVGRTDVSFRR